MKKNLIAIFTISAVSFFYHLLGVLNILPWQIAYSDIFPFAERAISPGWIYLEKSLEYPVILGMIIQFTGWIGQTAVGYFIANGILEIIIAIATTYLLVKLNKDNNKSIWTYWILAPSIFVFLHFNWDIVGIFFTVLAIYLYGKEKFNLSASVLALGFSTKLFPIILLLPLLIKIKTWRQRIEVTVSFISVALLVNIFFVIKNYDNWIYFYRFNAARAMNPDSIWTILTPFYTPYLYDVRILNMVIFSLMVVCIGFVLWKYREASFLQLCFWVFLLFFILNKIFTPQYILWLLPFFVLVYQPRKSIYYGLEVVNLFIIFGYLSFSFKYGSLPSYAILGVEVLAVVRHLLLLSILFFSFRQYHLSTNLSNKSII